MPMPGFGQSSLLYCLVASELSPVEELSKCTFLSQVQGCLGFIPRFYLLGLASECPEAGDSC